MTEEKLINTFIGDILDENKKIIILIGSGMSLNDSENNSSQTGVGSTMNFVEKFKEVLKQYHTNDYDSIIKEVEKGDNQYSELAKIIREKENNWSRINSIFKTEIIPILKNDLTTDDPNDFIEKTLRKKEVCSKISLNKGFEAFGKIAKYLNNKTRIYTSNFDPFIEIAFRKNNINFLQLHSSHNMENRKEISLSKQEIIIEHYHGYWLNDTAHTELEDWRHNIDAFKEIIKEHDSLFVFGYGGWKDSFSQAIYETIINTTNNCQIHWAFHKKENDIKEEIKSIKNDFKLLENVIKANTKCTSYYNINTNIFFQEMLTSIREKTVKNALTKYKENKESELNINKIFEKLPYKYGKLDNREEKNSKTDISDFILKRIQDEENIIVCSKFGLGKTTILENVFLKYVKKSTLNYAVLINLAYHELSKLTNNHNNSICEIIYKELSIKKIHDEDKEILKIIDDYLKNKKLLLLLDSIDESIYKDEELKNFRDKIIGFDFPIITSIRLEFHDFIDNAVEFQHWNYIAVEIEEWTETQLKKYLRSDSCRKKILQLKNLNRRPLFVNLLKKLNENNLSELKDNIADLYYATISESLDAEIELSTNENENENIKFEIKREYMDLLNSIAIAIYLEFQHYKFEPNYESKPKVTFNEDNLRLLASKNKYLDFDRVKKLFDVQLTNKVKIIKKVKQNESGQDEFTFFHRSFFEYLVANGAAARIIRDNKCSEAWDVYQTDEVSDYFVSDVERVNVRENNDSKISFFNAFKFEFIDLNKTLLDWGIDCAKKYDNIKDYYIKKKQNYSNSSIQKHLIPYSERLEEVLYYIGKFTDFWNTEQRTQFENFCKFIFYNARITFRNSESDAIEPAINPIYYRTSSITLSRLMKDNSYIFNYISYIISDYSTIDKFYYHTQIKKDTSYYGKEQLLEKCQKSYEEIFQITSEKNLNPLQILKIFSLFISVWYGYDGKKIFKVQIDKEKKEQINKMFNNLKSHFETHNFTNCLDMLEGIEYILNDISFPILYDEMNVEELLKSAIQKRKNITDYNILRLVNSNGDDLNYLEIDYYSGHIVIEAKKEEYYNDRTLICQVLSDKLRSLDMTVESISLKHNKDFELGSKIKGEVFYDELCGNYNHIIDCKEHTTNIIVQPKDFPKTGFFIDNRNIRKYIADNAENKKILNLCSFTCTIGAIAKNKNAQKIINLDKEEKYLDLGKKIYDKNNLQYDKSEFLQQDLNTFINEDSEEKFDIIILDLAEYAPIPCNFYNVSTHYKEINQKALKFLEEDGILITSCCSHGFSRNRFNKIIDEILSENNDYLAIDNLYLDKLEDHPIKENDIYSDYLKISAIKKICNS